MVTLYRVLSYFREPRKTLQRISQDLSSGLRLIKDCQKELVTIHNNTDELSLFSDQVYSHSCRIASQSDITPDMPRICQQQQHRLNSHCSDPKEYLKSLF